MAVAFQLFDVSQTGFIEREEVKGVILTLLLGVAKLTNSCKRNWYLDTDWLK